MNTNNTQNTLMDSPEALGHALCNLLPEMVQGFRVVTPSGEICVPAQETHPFVLTMEVMLMQQIRRLQNQSALRPVVAPQPGKYRGENLRWRNTVRPRQKNCRQNRITGKTSYDPGTD